MTNLHIYETIFKAFSDKLMTNETMYVLIKINKTLAEAHARLKHSILP